MRSHYKLERGNTAWSTILRFRHTIFFTQRINFIIFFTSSYLNDLGNLSYKHWKFIINRSTNVLAAIFRNVKNRIWRCLEVGKGQFQYLIWYHLISFQQDNSIEIFFMILKVIKEDSALMLIYVFSVIH